MNWIKKNKTIIILITIMLISSIWLIKKGMPYQHDIDFHSSRLLGLANTIKNGNFFALIHDTYYGFGYANGIFYSNFFFYINAFLIVLGVPLMTSFKLLNVFINIGTVLSIYFVSKSISKDKKISLIVTVLYMFASYRMVDVFVRSAIGETLAFMVIPIVFLGLYEIIYRDYKKWYIFTIGFVLLLLSHIITTILMASFVLLFLICNYKTLIKNKNRLKYLFISGGVGILLGAFFALPLLEQYKADYIQIFIQGTPIYLEDQLVTLKDFLIPNDLFNKHLGFSLILLLPIRFFIKEKKVKDINQLKYADILLILGIVAWLCTTGIFPWKKMANILGFIQFPWRLLIIATSFITFSYLIYLSILNNIKKDKKVKRVLQYSYIVVIVASAITIGIYSYNFGCKNEHYANINNENSIGGGEYLPANINFEVLYAFEEDYRVISSSLNVTSYERKGTNVIIKYENNTGNSYIEIPLFNYLGYKAEGATIVDGENHLIRLIPNENNGTIKVYYKGTTLTKASFIISGITLIGLVSYIIIERKKNNGISK